MAALLIFGPALMALGVLANSAPLFLAGVGVLAFGIGFCAAKGR